MTTLPTPIFDDTPPPKRQITICVKALVPPLNKSILLTQQTIKDYKRASLASLLEDIRLEALKVGYIIRSEFNENLRVWTVLYVQNIETYHKLNK